METVISYTQQAVKLQKKIIFNAGVESSLDYANPKKNYVPKLSILISPFGLPFVPIEIIGSDVGKTVSSMTWTKDRTNPGGLLSMSISPNPQIVSDVFNVIKKLPGGGFYSKIWNELDFNLEDLFKPMTLCQLWIDGYHVMTGTVRGCRRQSSVTNESYSPFYNITFDELGNLYNKSLLRLDTLNVTSMDSNITDDLLQGMVLASNIKLATVQQGIQGMIEAFKICLALNQNMSLSDAVPVAFRLMATTSPIGAIALSSFAQSLTVNASMFSLAGGESFWEFMKNFIPNPWMEFYTESGGRTIVSETSAIPGILFPGFNYIVSRSVPYSNPLLGIVNPAHFLSLLPFNLTAIHLLLGGDFVIITDDDIIHKDLGFDSTNQATSFRAEYSAGSGTAPADYNSKPIVSTGPLNPLASGGIGTFGVVEMVQNINCTQIFDAGVVADNILAKIAKSKISNNAIGILSKPALANLLSVWFRNQSRFREGSAIVKLKPWARPGMYCLYLPTLNGLKPENVRDIGIYYIDSLDHNYSLENESVSATTKLNLIRGVPLPTSIAKTALSLFDYEILPPESGIYDGETKTLIEIRRASKLASGIG